MTPDYRVIEFLERRVADLIAETDRLRAENAKLREERDDLAAYELQWPAYLEEMMERLNG